MRRFLFLAILIWPLAANAQSTELFPRPPEIEPAVNFWLKVYTEINTRNGFVHDARD
ncbi:MAG: lytic transglycosylase, partial [Gammaproteobacteria bacterium]|nr:lytic transglycosylase [Gammaproteobacteria bacterium]